MLENTVIENIKSANLPDAGGNRKNLLNALKGYSPDPKKFKIKPGHRNYIMNLMKEIDSTDVDDFFKLKTEPEYDIVQLTENEKEEVKELIQRDQEALEIKEEEELVVVNEDLEEEYVYETVDESEMNDEQYLLEYISDDANKLVGSDNYKEILLYQHTQGSSSIKRARRKPEIMYNEEFLAKKQNPRRRRVTKLQAYPDTDEGITQRFMDLVKQSLECILPKNVNAAIKHEDTIVYKEGDACWRVICPLCPAQIKLIVNSENGGKYINYKRSNFERHLRFKHCKPMNEKIMLYLKEFKYNSPSSPSNLT